MNASEANDGPELTLTFLLALSWPSVVSGCG